MDATQRLGEVFEWIDDHALEGKTAEVRIQVDNGELTVRAGGPGILSSPAGPPFQSYEVFMDHEPPRFWTKYSGDHGLVYARVPKLLLTHHIVRHGGIRDVMFHVEHRETIGVLKVQMLVPDNARNAVIEALSRVKGVRLTSSDFVTG